MPAIRYFIIVLIFLLLVAPATVSASFKIKRDVPAPEIVATIQHPSIIQKALSYLPLKEKKDKQVYKRSGTLSIFAASFSIAGYLLRLFTASSASVLAFTGAGIGVILVITGCILGIAALFNHHKFKLLAIAAIAIALLPVLLLVLAH